MATLLLIEDNRDLALGLRLNLERAGHRVDTLHFGRPALDRVRLHRPDIVLLDLSLPDIDGFAVLDTLRREAPTLPILVLTARRAQEAKLHGLRSGADDYMTKPFDLAELLVRVEVILRRAGVSGAATPDPPVADPITIGNILIDPRARRVTRDGTTVALSRLAFDLLLVLSVRRNEAVSRASLLKEVWGYADDVTSRTIDTHVFELRQQLERNPAEPRLIQTVWRVGYRLNTPEAAAGDTPSHSTD